MRGLSADDTQTAHARDHDADGARGSRRSVEGYALMTKTVTRYNAASGTLAGAVESVDGEFVRYKDIAHLLQDEPKAPPFKPGDRVQIGPDECGTFGTVLAVGTERCSVEYDNGAIRQPIFAVLKHVNRRAPRND